MAFPAREDLRGALANRGIVMDPDQFLDSAGVPREQTLGQRDQDLVRAQFGMPPVEGREFSVNPDAAIPPATVSQPPPATKGGGGDFGLGGIQGGLMRRAKERDASAKGAVGEIERAFQEKSAVLEDRAGLEEQKAAELAQERRVGQLAQEKIDADINAREAARRKHLEGAGEEIRRLEKEAADFKIDPDRRGFGSRIMGAVAIALGQYGAAISGGGPNVAAQIIRQQIDDDIAAQREELQGKRGMVQGRRNDMSVLRDRFRDEAATDDAYRARALAQSIAHIDSVAKEYEGAEASLGLKELRADLAAQKAEMQQKLLEAADNNFARNAQIAGGVAGDRATLAAKGGGKAAPIVPGARIIAGVSPDKEAVKKAQGIVAAANAYKSAIQALKAHREKYGAETFDREAVEKGRTLLATAFLRLKDAEEMGAVDKGSIELGQETLGGDPSGIGNKIAKYDTLLESIDANTRDRLRPYGFEPDDDATRAAELGGRAK